MMVRLNKYLADCGIGSRRACDRLIADGKVKVNGRIEQRLGTQVDELKDKVALGNRRLKPAGRLVYFLLNKPQGVVTTASDDRGRKTVLDLVDSRQRIFPVGRLDKDTTGLLLLTNDGQLAFRLMHPRYEVDKVYDVLLNSDLQEHHRLQLEAGVALEEGVTTPCKVGFSKNAPRNRVRVTLHQGWKRQVRRMFESVGYKVVELTRIRVGSLELGNLMPGKYRSLTRSEVAQLTKGNHGN